MGVLLAFTYASDDEHSHCPGGCETDEEITDFPVHLEKGVKRLWSLFARREGSGDHVEGLSFVLQPAKVTT